ncbi:MAG: tetratricopeptide repeat protein [Magnetococcales bacterium]|nr:tetratricopeptide repeat protein [Magnetococcales bacterium]
MTNLQKLLQIAVQSYQAGRLRDAERVVNKLLLQEPHHAEALHLLGVITHQSGHSDQALPWIQQAIVHQPNAPLFFNSLGMVLMAMDRLQEAEQAYRQALQWKPDFVIVYNNLGILFSNRGDLAAASHCFQQALSLQPNFPEAHSNLSDILREQGDLPGAIQHCREALRLRPEFAEARFNLGNILSASGDLEGAIQQFQRVLQTHPDQLLARLNLGNLLKAQNRAEAAIDQYRQILARQPDHLPALYNLGNALQETGQTEAAVSRYRQVLALQPDHTQALNNLRTAYTKLIPGWHFAMMHDEARNRAYEAALARVVTPDSLVLDIGSGSGLLALMAARLGAKRVISTEMVPLLARKAREIVQHNGFAETITVLDKKSTTLQVGTDLPERADILVTEIFDAGLLGEQAVAAIQHARSNLLKPDARIIPHHAVVCAALVESPRLWQEGFVGEISGFDLSPFNEFQRIHLQKRIQEFPHRVLTSNQDVFAFDFFGQPIREAQTTLPVTITAEGVCHGIVYWFRLFLDGETVIDTDPKGVYSHWMQSVQLLESPVPVRFGELFALVARHNRQAVAFELTRPSPPIGRAGK